MFKVVVLYLKIVELNPEFCPKWNSVIELLKVEIPHEIKQLKYAETKVLVLCQDTRTCFQLNHVSVKN